MITIKSEDMSALHQLKQGQMVVIKYGDQEAEGELRRGDPGARGPADGRDPGPVQARAGVQVSV